MAVADAVAPSPLVKAKVLGPTPPASDPRLKKSSKEDVGVSSAGGVGSTGGMGASGGGGTRSFSGVGHGSITGVGHGSITGVGHGSITGVGHGTRPGIYEATDFLSTAERINKPHSVCQSTSIETAFSLVKFCETLLA